MGRDNTGTPPDGIELVDIGRVVWRGCFDWDAFCHCIDYDKRRGRKIINDWGITTIII